MHTYLEQLPATHIWYSEDKNGAITLTRCLKLNGRKKVSDYGRIVLAMNDACCDRGRGKVYYLFSDPRRPGQRNQSIEEWNAYHMLMAIPGLVYLPQPWSKTQCTAWKAMTPHEKLHRAWGPHGWVEDEVAVLPFAAALQTSNKNSQPRFHGKTTAPVMVLVCPELYAGKTADLVRECTRIDRPDDAGGVQNCEYVAENSSRDALKSWRRENLVAVLEYLDLLFCKEPDLLVLYRVLRARIIVAQCAAMPVVPRPDQSERQAFEGSDESV